MLPKVSCVMTTFGRFTCVERSIGMFEAQDYLGESELIIQNTDIEYPIYLSSDFQSKKITIINNGIDQVTGLPYNNVGSIRRDALEKASGDLYICWDDDDIFLPWNIRQGVDGILKNGKKAWKPGMSFFKTPSKLELVKNTLEASVIVDITEVRKHGFLLKTGYEHLIWYTTLRDLGELDENCIEYVPSYCFNWSDSSEIAGHKQSGDIDNPNNFENHKKFSVDHALRGIQKIPDNKEIYLPFFEYLKENENKFFSEGFEKYVKNYLYI